MSVAVKLSFSIKALFNPLITGIQVCGLRSIVRLLQEGNR